MSNMSMTYVLPRIVRTVLIESPYKAPTLDLIERNIRYLRACMLDCLRKGEAPFGSHGIYTQILDDNDPVERALGIAAGLAIGDKLDITAVYTDLGISSGMNLGIVRAQSIGRPIEYRSIGSDW